MEYNRGYYTRKEWLLYKEGVIGLLGSMIYNPYTALDLQPLILNCIPRSVAALHACRAGLLKALSDLHSI
jgi:hypothetical protein